MTVICGFDATPPSRNALAYAVGQAARMGEHLVVAWVQAPASFAPMTLSIEPIDPAQVVPPETRAAIDERLGDAAWEFIGLHGDAAVELERLAVERQANVLVVGRSAKPHILGSVAGRLAKRAKCPVVVVP